MSAEVFRISLPKSARKSGVRSSFATQGGIRLRVVEATESASQIWRDLEQRIECQGLACSWAWTEAWVRHYGDLIPHRFIVGERSEPFAIALVTEGSGKKIGPFPIRTLHLGTAGEPDSDTVRVQYNRVLAMPEDRAEFTRGVIELFRSTDSRWDEFHLDGFAVDEVAPSLEPESAFETLRKVCYITELSAIRDAGKTLIAGLDSHAAKKIRKSIRLVEEECGPIHVEWAETLPDARDIFDEMVSLHEARWRAEGMQGVFSSTRFSGFHREIVERLFPHGGVLLARVKAGDVTLGCDYSLIERNRVLAYQWGIAALENKKISPGLVTAASVMQVAMDRGLDEYDWLAGDALYKRQLTTTSRELIWAKTSQGARIQAIYKLVEAKRFANRIPARLPMLGGKSVATAITSCVASSTGCV